MVPDHDFACRDHGAVASIVALTPNASDWLWNNVDAPAENYTIEAIVDGQPLRRLIGEPRYMHDIAVAMIDDGLTCHNSDRAREAA